MSYIATTGEDSTKSRVAGGPMLTACAYALSILLGGITLALASAKAFGEDSWSTLAVVCVLLLVTMAVGAYDIFSRDKHAAVYDPSFYMCLSGATYFGFGPLMYLFAAPDSIDNAQAYYPVTALDALFVTGMNAAGLGLAGLCFLIGSFKLSAGTAATAAQRTGSFPFSLVFYGSLTLGAAAKYLFILPYDFGFTEAVPSALAFTSAQFLLVTILAGFNTTRSANKSIFLLSYGLLITEVVIGLLMFNKTQMLLPIIAAGLGRYLQTFEIRALLTYAGFAVAVYVLATPVVTYARNVQEFLGGYEGQSFTLTSRAEIISAYVSGSQMELASAAPQAWWERLNNVPAQVAAVDFYNQGDGGTDYERLPWLIVPRALYADKPIMSDAGYALNEKVNGNHQSTVAVGIFVDGFYNWGYIGLAVYSATYGLMLRFFCEISRVVVRSRSVIMYPLIFMGVYAGMRPDGWWIIDVVNTWLIGAVLLVAYSFFPRR